MKFENVLLETMTQSADGNKKSEVLLSVSYKNGGPIITLPTGERFSIQSNSCVFLEPDADVVESDRGGDSPEESFDESPVLTEITNRTASDTEN